MAYTTFLANNFSEVFSQVANFLENQTDYQFVTYSESNENSITLTAQAPGASKSSWAFQISTRFSGSQHQWQMRGALSWDGSSFSTPSGWKGFAGNNSGNQASADQRIRWPSNVYVVATKDHFWISICRISDNFHCVACAGVMEVTERQTPGTFSPYNDICSTYNSGSSSTFRGALSGTENGSLPCGWRGVLYLNGGIGGIIPTGWVDMYVNTQSYNNLSPTFGNNNTNDIYNSLAPYLKFDLSLSTIGYPLMMHLCRRFNPMEYHTVAHDPTVRICNAAHLALGVPIEINGVDWVALPHAGRQTQYSYLIRAED